MDKSSFKLRSCRWNNFHSNKCQMNKSSSMQHYEEDQVKWTNSNNVPSGGSLFTWTRLHDATQLMWISLHFNKSPRNDWIFTQTRLYKIDQFMLEQLSMKFDQFYILWQLFLEWINVLHEQDSESTSMQARLHEMCNSNLDMTEVSLKQSSVGTDHVLPRYDHENLLFICNYSRKALRNGWSFNPGSSMMWINFQARLRGVDQYIYWQDNARKWINF